MKGWVMDGVDNSVKRESLRDWSFMVGPEWAGPGLNVRSLHPNLAARRADSLRRAPRTQWPMRRKRVARVGPREGPGVDPKVQESFSFFAMAANFTPLIHSKQNNWIQSTFSGYGPSHSQAGPAARPTLSVWLNTQTR